MSLSRARHTSLKQTLAERSPRALRTLRQMRLHAHHLLARKLAIDKRTQRRTRKMLAHRTGPPSLERTPCAASFSFSAARARDTRDITVPIGTSSTAAI